MKQKLPVYLLIDSSDLLLKTFSRFKLFFEGLVEKLGLSYEPILIATYNKVEDIKTSHEFDSSDLCIIAPASIFIERNQIDSIMGFIEQNERKKIILIANINPIIEESFLTNKNKLLTVISRAGELKSPPPFLFNFDGLTIENYFKQEKYNILNSYELLKFRTVKILGHYSHGQNGGRCIRYYNSCENCQKELAELFEEKIIETIRIIEVPVKPIIIVHSKNKSILDFDSISKKFRADMSDFTFVDLSDRDFNSNEIIRTIDGSELDTKIVYSSIFILTDYIFTGETLNLMFAFLCKKLKEFKNSNLVVLAVFNVIESMKEVIKKNGDLGFSEDELYGNLNAAEPNPNSKNYQAKFVKENLPQKWEFKFLLGTTQSFDETPCELCLTGDKPKKYISLNDEVLNSRSLRINSYDFWELMLSNFHHFRAALQSSRSKIHTLINVQDLFDFHGSFLALKFYSYLDFKLMEKGDSKSEKVFIIYPQIPLAAKSQHAHKLFVNYFKNLEKGKDQREYEFIEIPDSELLSSGNSIEFNVKELTNISRVNRIVFFDFFLVRGNTLKNVDRILKNSGVGIKIDIVFPLFNFHDSKNNLIELEKRVYKIENLYSIPKRLFE